MERDRKKGGVRQLIENEASERNKELCNSSNVVTCTPLTDLGFGWENRGI